MAMTIGGLITYAFNFAILRPIYLEELNQYGLTEKYFFLDLNADLMREDLAQMGIAIDAKHFNIQEAEKRLEEQEHIAEAKKESTK